MCCGEASPARSRSPLRNGRGANEMRGFGDIAERLRRSTVQIFNGSDQSRGSGIIWNAGGLIVTNAHVARSSEAEIELWDGRRVHARVASRDRRRDLATLRMAAADGDL